MTQTSEQVQRQQAQDAARRRAEQTNAATRPKTRMNFDDIRSGHYDTIKELKAAPAPLLDETPAQANTLPVPSGGNAVGTYADPHTAVDQFVAENESTGGMPRVKFSKDGAFVRTDTDEKITDDIDFVAPVDMMRDGYIAFNGEGQPPSRIAGLPFEGFVPPSKDDLPDRDKSLWEPGLNGEPEDRWRRNVEMPLQRRDTGELLCFSTMSITGRGAVTQLVNHYRRMQRTHPADYPVVRLKTSGFTSKKKGVGWVSVPQFVVVGRAPRDSVAVPDSSLGADMDDAIPDFK